MNNIMIDLETLGQGSNALIISIGAVKFDRSGIDPNHFYNIVDMTDAQKYGLDIDAQTVVWWLKQSTDARSVFNQPGEHLVSVLYAFAAWLPQNAVLWGNGSDFDNSILANAYRCAHIQQPWKFWNNRCYRTVKNLFDDRDLMPDRQGTHHNALDDAVFQASHLINIANNHGLSL